MLKTHKGNIELALEKTCCIPSPHGAKNADA